VRFEQRDVSAGLPEQYDVITTFDVVHDAVNPRGLLRAIRNGLRPGGHYVCLEINSSDRMLAIASGCHCLKVNPNGTMAKSSATMR